MTDDKDKEVDELLEKIRAKRDGGFKTFRVRITVPFYTEVLVSAKSSEKALKQVQWDLMPDDREHMIETAEWKHMFGKQFNDCTIKEAEGYDLDKIPALEDLKSSPAKLTDEERKAKFIESGGKEEEWKKLFGK